MTTIAPRRKGWCPGALRPMETGDGLIARVRASGGRLTLDQAATIAAAARACGNGVLALSARANLQIRGVSEATLAELHRTSRRGRIDRRRPGRRAPAQYRRQPLERHRPGRGLRPRPERRRARTASRRGRGSPPASAQVRLRDRRPRPSAARRRRRRHPLRGDVRGGRAGLRRLPQRRRRLGGNLCR